MKVRRIAFALSAVVLIAGAALGAGVALGSGSSRADDPDTKFSGGAQSTRASATKPKSQAYVHFLTDGTIVGNSKKVLAVHETSTGRYCVDLASSIHVSEETFVNMTVDWNNTPGNLTVATRGASSTCTGLGFSNSIRILVWQNDSGTSANADASLFFTVP